MTGRHRRPKRKRSWRPLATVITTLYYVAVLDLWVSLLYCERYIFHRRVWYRALSLRNARTRRSGIILIPQATFQPNYVSVATSIAELARGE